MLKSSSELKARDTMPLNGVSGAKASTRLWITSRLASFSSSFTWVRKRVFLPLESSSVKRRSGNRMASGIPGMPPPLPTSSQSSPSAATWGTTLRLSSKWRDTISSGSRTAVRL
ncbi:hypothetical protein D3C84_976960 [compost metagenome]